MCPNNSAYDTLQYVNWYDCDKCTQVGNSGCRVIQNNLVVLYVRHLFSNNCYV